MRGIHSVKGCGWKIPAAVCVVGLPLAVWAGLSGSAHDFSAVAWSGGRACVPCHTAHNAVSAAAPLWNHQVTQAVFELYESRTLQEAPLQTRHASRLCLSCHDGTVAIDAFGGAAGEHRVSGTHNIGVDLSSDHPVSLRWQHQSLHSMNMKEGCSNCHSGPGGGLDSELPFFNGYMECSTCHDVHNEVNADFMLRKSTAGSGLCVFYHQDK